MIIAYDVSYIQSRRGGIGRYAVSLLQELLRMDRENRYILHGWSFSIDMDLLRGMTSPRVVMRALRLPGFVKRAYWDMLAFPPVSVFTGHFDLFLSTDPFLPPAGRSRTIVTVHDLLSRTHPQFFERSVLARDSKMAASVSRAAAVIVPSMVTRSALIQSGMAAEGKVHLVVPPLGAAFTPDAKTSDEETVRRLGLKNRYLLYVGTIEPRKNIIGLIEAFEGVCREGIDPVDLAIVGKMGWMSEEVPAFIERSEFASRIRRLGYVREADLPALYRRAECFVYPSFVEGYGSPVAEAMASGLPVVTSESSGTSEVAGEGALLVDPRSRAGIVTALKRILTSESERQRLRMVALARAAELRERRSADALLKLFKALT